ncbi:MAG TPA: PhnD/SsuA/transferrin family substrate-binding protein [Kofleriaceae bacterium]|nr:PhnD/SsuA/transferrin family substrate-binding protein [Kofleriaceae bacterium]
MAANPAPQPTLPPPPGAASASAQPAREATLVLATIADNPQEGKDKDAEAAQLLPFLVQKLGAYGITHAKLVYCHNPAELAQWIKEGIVDIVDESPFASYIAHRLSGASEVILNRWKNYNEKFGGVLFTRADSPIKKLDDLKGKLIAFRGDTSTTQYFLQKVQLIKQGYKLVEVASPTAAKVGPNEIGYYFAWSSRDKVTEDVFDGLAAAGGNSDEFIEKLLGHYGTEQGGKSRHPRAGAPQIKLADLRVIARSPLVTRRVVTVRTSLDPKLKTAIKDLLLGLEASEEGRAILKSFGPAKKFTAVDEATAYAGIADQGELIESEVARFTKQ